MRCLSICLTLAIWCWQINCACAQSQSFYEQGVEAAFHQDYQAAIENYKKSMDKEPLHAAESAKALFDVYKQLHMYDEAAQQLDQICRISGNSGFAITLGKLYQEAGRHYEAQRVYQNILAQKPDDAEALLGMGMTSEALGNVEQAREYYTRLRALGGTSAAAANAHLLAIKNAGTVSIDSDAFVLGIWPKSKMPLKYYIEECNLPFYQPQMRQIIVSSVGRWVRASNGLVQAVQVDTESDADITVRFVASLPHAIGITRSEVTDGVFRRADIELAIGCDSRGHSLPAEDATTEPLYMARDRMFPEVVLHELGHALGLAHSPNPDDIMANGVFGLHSADVQSVRDLQPGDVQRIVALYSGQPDDRRAVSPNSEPAPAARVAAAPRRPSTSSAQANLGSTKVNTDTKQDDVQAAVFDLNAGKFDDARECLERALNRNPHDIKAHYLMAVIFVRLRQYNRAIEHYQTVIKLAPGTELCQRAKEGLVKLDAGR